MILTSMGASCIIPIKEKAMRKTFISIFMAVVCCFAAFALCGCNSNNTDSDKYTLTVKGDSDRLLAPLNSSYAAGEQVTFKVGVFETAYVEATLNGKALQYMIVEQDGGYAWEISFAMPNKNSELNLSVVPGMLSCLPILSNVAYYDLAYTSDSSVVGFRLNAYVQSLTVWDEIKPLLPKFESNYDEKFFERKALLVLFGEKGTGESGTIESAAIDTDGYKMFVTINAKAADPGDSAPTVMTEWVVVIETENNLSFSNIEVKPNF